MVRLIIDRGNKKEIELFVPEEWNELNAGQLSQLSAILIASQADTYRTNVLIAKILLNIDAKTFSRINPGVILESILPLCEWVHNDNTLTTQLIPTLSLKEVKLYGPSDNLGNLKLVEWDFAERTLADWVSDPGHIETLATMVAILYRPAKENYDFERDTDGDARIIFNDNLVRYYSKQMLEEIPVSVLLSIMFWYRGCRAIITDNYSVIFNSGKKSNKASDDAGYFDLMRAIAKEGTYGDFDKVEQMYLLNALQELKCSKEEAEAIKTKFKKDSL